MGRSPGHRQSPIQHISNPAPGQRHGWVSGAMRNIDTDGEAFSFGVEQAGALQMVTFDQERACFGDEMGDNVARSER